MKCIALNYDPFAKDCQITYYEDKAIKTVAYSDADLESLAENVGNWAYSLEAFRVLVHAPDAIYEELKEKVSQLENNTYSTNKIEWELL